MKQPIKLNKQFINGESKMAKFKYVEEVIIEDIEEKEEPTPNTEEEEEVEKNKEETIPDVVPTIQNIDDTNVLTKLSFNDIDSVLDETNNVDEIEAPKSIERLEDISTTRALERKLEEESDTDDDDRIQIHTDLVDLSGFDILDEKISFVNL